MKKIIVATVTLVTLISLSFGGDTPTEKCGDGKCQSGKCSSGKCGGGK